VPPGTARLRIALSAAHTAADVEELLAALVAHAADCVAALPQKNAGTGVAPAAVIA
jgi:8-amino-7-oxononanoate synthase